MFAVDSEVTLYAIGSLVVVVRKLNVPESTWESHDLVILAGVTFPALSRGVRGCELRVAGPDLLMAIDAIAV